MLHLAQRSVTRARAHRHRIVTHSPSASRIIARIASSSPSGVSRSYRRNISYHLSGVASSSRVTASLDAIIIFAGIDSAARIAHRGIIFASSSARASLFVTHHRNSSLFATSAYRRVYHGAHRSSKPLINSSLAHQRISWHHGGLSLAHLCNSATTRQRASLIRRIAKLARSQQLARMPSRRQRYNIKLAQRNVALITLSSLISIGVIFIIIFANNGGMASSRSSPQ